jgi:hypothetical protein
MSTMIAPGVARHDCHWGYYLEGTKDALLRAGVAESKWFLDGRKKAGHGKTIRTVYAEQHGVPVECTQPARGLCMVRFLTGKEELDPLTCGRIRARSLSVLFGQGHALARDEMALIAAADTGFQRFMQRTVSDPDQAQA